MANKPNEGVLFLNKDKTTEAHPNAKGSATIDGLEYWVSAWTNTAQTSGERYQKLKFQPKNEDARRAQEPANKPAPDFDDDLPF